MICRAGLYFVGMLVVGFLLGVSQIFARKGPYIPKAIDWSEWGPLPVFAVMGWPITLLVLMIVGAVQVGYGLSRRRLLRIEAEKKAEAEAEKILRAEGIIR